MILHGIGDARAPTLSPNGALRRPRATRITKKSSGGATSTARFVHCLAKQSPRGNPGAPRPTSGCYFGDFSMIIASVFHGFLDRFRLHFMLFFNALVEGIGACFWYRFMSFGSNKSWTTCAGSVCYLSFNLRILLATLFVCFGRNV